MIQFNFCIIKTEALYKQLGVDYVDVMGIYDRPSDQTSCKVNIEDVKQCLT